MRFTKSQDSSIDILSDGMKTPRTPLTPSCPAGPTNSISGHLKLTNLNSGNNGNHIAVIETKIHWSELLKLLIVKGHLIQIVYLEPRVYF